MAALLTLSRGFFLSAAQSTLLVQAQVEDHPGFVRVLLSASSPFQTGFNKAGEILEIRIISPMSLRFRSLPVHSRLVRSLSWARTKQGYLLTVECLHPDFIFEASTGKSPYSWQVDLRAPASLAVQFSENKPSLPSVSHPEEAAKLNLKVKQEGDTQGGTGEKTQVAARTEVTDKSEVASKLDAVAKPVVNLANEATTRTEEAAKADKIPIKPIEPIEKIENKTDELLAAGARRIKTIVIDPGHGGLEVGAKGPGGTLEKDVVLSISLKLKNIIERQLAIRVVLTRDKDTDISLENRAALANNNRADLFLSIHANGSYRQKAHGSETYFLSLKATDEEARRLAYLENSSPDFEKKIEEESQDQIMMILWDMAQAAFLKQSSQLAEFIQKELNSLLGTTDRGIKQAPFKVLTGVACPAVLVEVAFISNPEEEAKLRDETFQENVALALFRGLLNYLRMTS